MNWGDKRDVHLLSTVHTGDLVNTGKVNCYTKKPVFKPDVVVDYNINMRLIDKADAQISDLKCMRKSSVWYLKLFYHLIDVSILNAFNLWLLRHESAPLKKLKLRVFLNAVCMQLLEEYGVPTKIRRGRCSVNMPDRVKGPSDRHFLKHTEMINGRRRSLECYVCKHTTRRPQKRTRVNVVCNECQVALCIDVCFQEFHSLKNF